MGQRKKQVTSEDEIVAISESIVGGIMIGQMNGDP